jgi:hypothetical protein
MTLFALTSVPGARVIRFPMTAELNAEVDAAFAEQLRAFEAGIVDVIPFDGRYVPDQGELLVIEEFEDVDGLQEAVSNPLNVEAYDPARHSLDSVKALFTSVARDGVDRILIQCFERRRLIAAKGLAMYFMGDAFRKMTDSGLTLDTRLVAVLDGSSLKFQSFHFVRRVFDLSEHFKEATNEEVTTFATHAKMAIADLPAFLSSASPLVRKKIALIRQSGVLENFTTEQIVASAQAFNVVVATTDDNRIVIPSNKTELRRLLRFLDEDYYESALSQTRYVSNSKRVAD